MKPLSSILLLLILMLALAGCTSIVNVPQGKVVSVTTRVIGLSVTTTTPTANTPEVKFGFASSAIVLIPTSTNGPVQSPNFANTFDFAQTGALQLGIGESIASGNYATFATGNTNSAPTTKPVVPK